jgi:integrase
MSTDLVPRRDATLARLQDVAEQARDYAADAKAPATKRAYTADWKHFTTWCDEHGLPALPAAPQTLILYLTELADTHKVSTLQRRISAVSQAHKAAGHTTPTGDQRVRLVMAGIRRRKGVAQEGKAPATIEVVRHLVDTLGKDLMGKRDRALLLVGFAGAFRRSELVSLNLNDVQFTKQGLIVSLRRSKTDQEGEGRKVGIPPGVDPSTCPVRALRAWLDGARIQEGAIFRSMDRHGNVKAQRLSSKSVALIVKRCAESAGLDPEDYAGHSLRAGLATSAAAAGVSERAIMQQTGHTSTKMVRKYIRDGSLFRDNAAGKVGM